MFSAVVEDSHIILKWRTESEINNLGFDVYRSENPDGKFVKVNSAYIKGAGTDSTPHDYQFVDESITVGKTYYYYIEDISYSGERNRSRIIQVTIDPSGKLKVVSPVRPTTFALLQNYPNPFNPETWVPFQLANDTDVTIRIYNIKGQIVRTLHLGNMPAGFYYTKDKAAYWDGRDDYSQKVSSGVYFYNLTAGAFKATKKLIIIK
ncbi:T9SS type A sorting domain-containing protein [Candidatus Poribacteria bacterium]|nr:T9SS type A sorting domain-containing protein [Candidatus Poribacteria bacterium]